MADSLAPSFLIAFPHLMDRNFRQSVVLLLQHESEGATGVVVNHESPILLRDLCRDQQIPYRGDAKKLVRSGGPVQPEQGLVLYDSEYADPEGRGVVDGLHVSTARGTLERLSDLESGRFHCFSGYAGWGPEQLESEIQAGAWLVTDVEAATVLEIRPDDMWLACLHKLGIDPAALVPGSGETA